MTCLPGTLWDYWEDNLTVPRLLALKNEWQRNPPVHLLAAAYLEYKPPAELGESRSKQGGNLNELLSMFPGGVVK